MITFFTSPVSLARDLDFIRETTQNHGAMVEAIQRWSGGQPGDSWCAFFILFVLDICLHGKVNNPIVRSGRVEDIYEQAKSKGWIVESPMPNDLFIFVDQKDHAVHIGFVTAPGSGIAGNTSADGHSENGDRVAEHELIHGNIKYVRYY